MDKYLSISEEVKTALMDNRPVVALESTIIAHGMPYPENVVTAKSLEETITNNYAVPATIAIINGIIKVGLSIDEIGFANDKNILKASRRDVPVIVSQKLSAATTVSATMLIAKLAGIKVFATGGIGGVHKHGEKTFDISADLTELGQTDIAVVSAGVKSILDIGLTLEYLETLGVPVIGFGTDDFPAFYTRDSGFKVNYRMDTPEEIADTIRTKWKLGLNGGVLIANPIPEMYSMNKAEIDAAIHKALIEAKKKDITGKEVTPFLLSAIKEITKGKSLEANIQLVLNNAELAARIAQSLIEN